MMSSTHIVMGVAVASFAMGTTEPATLAAAALATQLPDVDTSKSIVGRVMFPLSSFLENRFPHRTVTHSFLCTGIVALLALPLRFYGFKELWTAVVIGFFFGWFGDVFTRSGVAAFYPMTTARLVIPGNPNLRLRTGSKAEWIVLIIFVGLFGVSFQLHSAGGFRAVFNSALAQPSGVAELWRKSGHAYQILAQIEGHNGATPINAEFEVVDVLAGDSLLVRGSSGLLYTAGTPQDCLNCDFKVSKAKARAGLPITTRNEELRLTNQDAAKAMRGLNVPATSRAWVSGELVLNDAEDFALPRHLERFNSIQISGEAIKNVRLNHATLEDLTHFAGLEATGQLLVKIVEVKQ